MRKLERLLWVGCTVFLISSCGSSGPLYLPEKTNTSKPPPSASPKVRQTDSYES